MAEKDELLRCGDEFHSFADFKSDEFQRKTGEVFVARDCDEFAANETSAQQYVYR